MTKHGKSERAEREREGKWLTKSVILRRDVYSTDELFVFVSADPHNFQTLSDQLVKLLAIVWSMTGVLNSTPNINHLSILRVSEEAP